MASVAQSGSRKSLFKPKGSESKYEVATRLSQLLLNVGYIYNR